jgi:hypothetical protein
MVGLSCAMLMWIGVAAEVFVSQFFHYIPAQGWLVHPLVVMPWLKYVPPALMP